MPIPYSYELVVVILVILQRANNFVYKFLSQFSSIKLFLKCRHVITFFLKYFKMKQSEHLMFR